MATKPRFQYARRTVDDVKERANKRGGNFDSIYKSSFKVYKVREGKNMLRILPPTWEKPKHYGFDIWVNYGIGADNQSYLSLSKMKNQKDPIAEARLVATVMGMTTLPVPSSQDNASLCGSLTAMLKMKAHNCGLHHSRLTRM